MDERRTTSEVPDSGFAPIFYLLIKSLDSRYVLVHQESESTKLPGIIPPREFGSMKPLVDTWDGDTEQLCECIKDQFQSFPYLRCAIWYHPNPLGRQEAIIAVDFYNEDLVLTEPRDIDSLSWLGKTSISLTKWSTPHENCDLSKIDHDYLELSMQELQRDRGAGKTGRDL